MTAVVGVLNVCRLLARRTHNSAVLLVGSFAVMILVGTLLLKLPSCRALAADGTVQPAADWNVALFTATSASCVTGLIVEPTGSYWSSTGHFVIFCLFQIGGLGILTFGAFIAVLSGRRGLQFREARTLRDMLDAESVQGSRRLLLTILLFTFCLEGLGAVSLLGLWPELSSGDRIWWSVFHSVSAFCNAGFSLSDDGFLNLGGRWQVWGAVTMLIILGGLGFPVIEDIWLTGRRWLKRRRVPPLFHQPGKKPHLTLHSRLVLWTTTVLLIGGAVAWFTFESLEAPDDSSALQRTADAWFQSVTFRTAGFNTVEHKLMHPVSKLLAIFLMFIGAAPGSTGGGVKTIVLAITLLNIWAVFRGRDRIEVFGRCIPTNQVARALSMIAVGVFIVMATTGLLVIFERSTGVTKVTNVSQSHRAEETTAVEAECQKFDFIDLMYEATSAFATVGVSAGVTGQLSIHSQLLICVVMFLGRIGPITLLLAMAAPSDSDHYDYPEERVSLG
ncbi:MAG: potassium transporter TrkG [Planctomycetaceae bacterium]